jgi:cysteinyl-tRNA synthetase, unknown class
VSFAADHRELDNVPAYPATIHNVNDSDVAAIGDVKNFLYLINPSAYSTKQSFLDAIKNTNYDMALIDLYFNDEQLTLADVTSLKVKLNGGSRLVICYMSIGEAENYRYYWSGLNQSLIYNENPDWAGNFSVKYWEKSWKDVIYGNDQSYTKKILEVGFDGVYLDIIEAYEYFE